MPTVDDHVREERADRETHHYVHQDDEHQTRVSEFGEDEEILISTHFDGEEHPYSAEVFDMEQAKFIYESLGRILDEVSE